MTTRAWKAILELASRATSVGVEVAPDDRLIFHIEATSSEAVPNLVSALNARFSGLAQATRLFEDPDPDTARFIELTFADVHADLAAPVAYDAAYALADDHADVVTVEPDLPNSFFLEPDEIEAEKPGTESAIVGLFCEVDGAPPVNKHWAIDQIRVKEAMAYSKSVSRLVGGAGVLVAQPDTGIGPNAELEPGSIAPGEGWDVIGNQPGARDPLLKGNPGHGTATGSCVVSRTAGQIHGAAPAATLYPIRAITAVIISKAGPVAKAIERAVIAKAQVITMSLGGVPSRAVRAAIKRARKEGLIVMAAAGNCAKLVVWPARYPECLAVAGCNVSRMPWKGTCLGPSVDITAPAEQVWHASLTHPDGIKHGQGTSFAVALTAGAAAQWLAHHGQAAVLKAAQDRGVTVHDLFRTALQATAQPEPLLPKHAFGSGIVDVEALLKLPLDSIGQVASVQELQGDDPGDVMPPEYEEIYGKFGGEKPESVRLDWRRYGAEMGRVALRRAVSAEAEQAPLVESSPAASSSAVRQAVVGEGDRALKAWLGVAL